MDIKTFSHDEIRSTVLTYFFTIYETKPNTWLSSARITRDLKQIEKSYIIAAIEFLLDEKYLKEQRTAAGMKRYKISNKGIQEFAPSRYRTQSISPLTISSKGGIFVFGDNLGSIKQETVQSFDEINQLIKFIKNSQFKEDKKRDLIGDAETLKAQLTKSNPEKSILQKAWGGLQYVSTLNESITLLQTIGQMVHGYIK